MASPENVGGDDGPGDEFRKSKSKDNQYSNFK
jgi:hypothetical protein